MAQIKFQCPECGIGDHEVGPMAEIEIYCIVCLEEHGRAVRLHAGRKNRLRRACARACSPPEQLPLAAWVPLSFALPSQPFALAPARGSFSAPP
jgi:hypothetical protein